jgi:hypothetical protein
MTKEKKQEETIEVGQVIDISLESMMGSTGYGWELSELTGPISLLGITIVPSSTAQIGPVTQVFTFKARGTGEAKISFILTAAWKLEKPIEEVHFTIHIVETNKVTEDDLKIKGFVAAPKASVRENAVIPPYNVQPPVLEYGIPCADMWQRLYYGVLPQNLATADPRLYYGVCCDPSTVTSFGDVRMYYGVRCAPVTVADPRVYYGVCCAPTPDPKVYYGVCCAPDTDPKVYYGVCCAPESDECGTPPQIYKYGILPRMKYNVNFPFVKYNIPPVGMRYNYPGKCE